MTVIEMKLQEYLKYSMRKWRKWHYARNIKNEEKIIDGEKLENIENIENKEEIYEPNDELIELIYEKSQDSHIIYKLRMSIL